MKDAGLEGLTTARLKLRRLTLDDAEMLHRLNSDANVMKHLGGPITAEASREMLEGRIIGYYTQHPGLGVWATCERESGECVGLHLLNHIQGETLVQVGYRLFEASWGRGYATEMSIALLRYGFTQLRLPTLVGIANRDNLGSQQVLLKSGLHRGDDRAFAHPAYASYGPLAYFERNADEWLEELGR